MASGWVSPAETQENAAAYDYDAMKDVQEGHQPHARRSPSCSRTVVVVLGRVGGRFRLFRIATPSMDALEEPLCLVTLHTLRLDLFSKSFCDTHGHHPDGLKRGTTEIYNTRLAKCFLRAKPALRAIPTAGATRLRRGKTPGWLWPRVVRRRSRRRAAGRPPRGRSP